MFARLFILFAVMPIVEIALLLEVGEMIGGWITVFIVILTAFIGAKLVREQGISTLQNLQKQTATGQLPAETMVEGLMLLVAGVLLVTPGFVTDIIGFLLTIPLTRKPIAAIVYAKIKDKIVAQSAQSAHSAGFSSAQSFHYSTQPSSSQAHVSQNNASGGNVIEGEYERKND
ncbi:FxsA family protein [Algibacillus agarilyticus]|uniref:FxsA family protein n=1 Tax=Algibacillus agarilyticus TaxID=2234133 RepID=UPI000DCFE600|nr:FxsA family protein [Algibacillus agarilyticus]